MSKLPLFAFLALGLLPASSVFAGQNHPYPGADHDTLGECYDYVVTQYNDNGDEEGLDWGLDNCDDSYAEMVAPAGIDQLRGTTKGEPIGVPIILGAPSSTEGSGSETSRQSRRR
jgi:hypothetical protein